MRASSAGLLWLCRDHDEIRELARLLSALVRRGGSTVAVERCARLLRERVEEHERDEETFLHGRVMRASRDPEVLAEIRKVLRWHDRIDSDAVALTRGLESSVEALVAAAERLARELERHFEYEERVFYPMAERLLGAADEEALRDELRGALAERIPQLDAEN